MRLQVLYRLAVRLRVGINEVIQRFALLVRRKTNITAVREKNAINVVGAEREVALGGIFPGFRSIHRNPADAHEITGSVFPRKVGDGAIERNELVGFEVT